MHEVFICGKSGKVSHQQSLRIRPRLQETYVIVLFCPFSWFDSSLPSPPLPQSSLLPFSLLPFFFPSLDVFSISYALRLYGILQIRHFLVSHVLYLKTYDTCEAEVHLTFLSQNLEHSPRLRLLTEEMGLKTLNTSCHHEYWMRWDAIDITELKEKIDILDFPDFKIMGFVACLLYKIVTHWFM